MKKLVLAFALASLVVTAGFSATTIKLGYSTNSKDPRGVASQLFKEEVEKNSKGNILIEIYDSGKLGSDTQLIEGVISGKVDMTVSSAGNFAVYATKVGVSALPFLFTDFAKSWKFMDSDIVTGVNKELEASNIVVLAHYDNGFRCVTTSNKPVNKVADMKGLKIRTPPNQIVMETMTALGAKPEPLDFGKLIPALQSGQFNAQENPIPVIYNNKLYTVQKYLAVTNHSYDAMPLVIRKDMWDKFSAANQKIIKDAAIKAQNADRKIVKEQTDTLVSSLQKEGMTVTKPNLAEFADATKGVLDEFSEVYGKDLMDKVKAFTK
jgi:tripartite ATP-independent transporter DctP family solute receptor